MHKLIVAKIVEILFYDLTPNEGGTLTLYRLLRDIIVLVGVYHLVNKHGWF